ncbi:MAG TPA: UDP-glucose/GDP-mannose dehydrogenase family protein [Verrucomicrobiae bacterium]|nr:UDP-glucose/GDP-mannose dehydrogenase family protein [Verrucomicrobiae bacterium]
MRIAVVGSGYVGLVSAACFAEIGHEVISVDNDENKIAALQRGEVPIHELHLPELLAAHRGGRLRFSTSLKEAVRASDAIFITVGTPQSENGEADLSFVEAVAHEMASAIHSQKLVVEKSTVPVRTCEWLRKSLLLNGAQSGAFSVASNPEFLREGTAVVDFLYPDRIVIGADDRFSASLLREIYAPLTSGSYYSRARTVPSPGYARAKAPLIVTNAKSAELIKHASNAFLAMKISFINAVANISEAVGADIDQVCAGVGSDSRIGPKFLNAGIGYGGSCFPKDVQAFHVVARECGYDFGLLSEVMEINNDQRARFLKKVRSALWNLRGKHLGVLGLAFKGDTDDIRESPAVSIIQSLLKEGARVSVYDPAAMQRAKIVLRAEGVAYAADPYHAATQADALLILTEWKEFAALDLPRLRSLLKYSIVIDGRNLYDPARMAEAGFLYHSIGRATAVPKHMSSLVAPIAAEAALAPPAPAFLGASAS